jgi:hypothetical protein
MQAIAKAHENRSLADFEEALKVYKAGKQIFIRPNQYSK